MRAKRLRILGAVAAVGITVLAAGPAFAGTITSPTAPFTAPLNAAGTGPTFFQITGTGFPPGTALFAEICDGVPSTAPGWDPTVNCDNVTSTAADPANAAGNVTFNISNINQRIGIFDGVSPSQLFECLNPGEADPGVAPAFTNCQVRVSSNTGAVTADQAFLTFTLPHPSPPVPETPYAIYLPIGALLLLGGGYVALRRRHRHLAGTPA